VYKRQGLLATVLTLAVAFGKKGIVGNMRSILPKINLISAVVLVIVGAYVALYGFWQIQVFDPELTPTGWVDAIVLEVESWQAGLSNFIGDLAPTLGVVFLALNLALAAIGYLVRSQRPSTPTHPPVNV